VVQKTGLRASATRSVGDLELRSLGAQEQVQSSAQQVVQSRPLCVLAVAAAAKEEGVTAWRSGPSQQGDETGRSAVSRRDKSRPRALS